MAWALSAQVENRYSEWDLWMMWSNQIPHGYEKLENEYRIYDRIHKRKIWHVGMRIFKPRHEKTI